MNLPKHIGIIMDGNGRWAKNQNLPRTFGHKAGVEALRSIVTCCSNLNIQALSVYAFSTENWKRPRLEIEALMGLLVEFVAKEVEQLCKNNVKLIFTGELEKLSKRVLKAIDSAHEKTKNNTGLTLNIAVNYSGRNDILNATKAIAKMAKNNDLVYNQKHIQVEEITEEFFESFLSTKTLPPLDLVIRTSGQERLSNFMCFESAYSELIFTDVLWPDFDENEFQKCLLEFSNRTRNFGGLK